MMYHVFLILMSFHNFAFADAEEAEQNRIRSEIQQYRKISDWKSMNKGYEDLLLLKSAKHPLNFSDYVLGAFVAQELGLLQDCVDRLQIALKINPNAQEEKGWLDFIISSTEYVSVKVATKDRTLLIEETPFDPVFQKAIDVADLAFQTEGRFEGRLPFGVYTYGTQSFTVVKGEKTRIQRVDLFKNIDDSSVETKKEQPVVKQEKKQKPPKEQKIFDFSLLSMSIAGETLMYIPSKVEERSLYAFTTMGPHLGIVYRQRLKNILGIDGALLLGISGHYASKTTINMYGGSIQALLAKRFGNLEVGFGYSGSINSLKWNLNTANIASTNNTTDVSTTDDSTGDSNQQNNSGTTDTSSIEEICQTGTTEARCMYASSGIGVSVLWDFTANVGIGVNSAVTWDGEFSPFVSGTANLVISLR